MLEGGGEERVQEAIAAQLMALQPSEEIRDAVSLREDPPHFRRLPPVFRTGSV